MAPNFTTTHDSSLRCRRCLLSTAAAVDSVLPLPRRLFRLAAAADIQSRSLFSCFHFSASIVAVILLPPLPPSLLSHLHHCYCPPTAAAKSSLRRCRRCCCRLVTYVADVATVLPYRHCGQVKLTPPPSLMLSLLYLLRYLVATAWQVSAATTVVSLPPLPLRLKAILSIYVNNFAPPPLLPLPSRLCCHYCIAVLPLTTSQACASAVADAIDVVFLLPSCCYLLWYSAVAVVSLPPLLLSAYRGLQFKLAPPPSLSLPSRR